MLCVAVGFQRITFIMLMKFLEFCQVQQVVNLATSSAALENVPESKRWEIGKRKKTGKLGSGDPLSTDGGTTV